MSESSDPFRSIVPLTNPPTGSDEQLELKLPDESSSPRDLGLWAGVLVLLTLVVYWPATTGSFLWRDDRAANSPKFVTPGALSRIWLDRWTLPDQYSLPVYQPVALTAYYLEYQFGGHNAQSYPMPMAYHVASLIFLAGSSILLWLVLREMKLTGAWLIAAVFALHPVHAETVSWIDQQPIVLMGLFFIGSVYTYLLYTKSFDLDRAERAAGQQGIDPAQTWGLFGGSIVLALLAMLSDPSAVVLPVIILLLLWWQRRSQRLDINVQLGLLIVGVILWLKNLLLVTKDTSALIHSGLLLQFAAMGSAMLHGMRALLLPLHLSVIYPESLNAIGFVFLIVLAIFCISAYKSRDRRARSLFIGFVSFGLLAGSSINWFDSTRQTRFGDGAAYLSIVPLSAILIIFLARQLRSLQLPVPNVHQVVGLSAILLVTLGTGTWVRAHIFETPVSLWSNTLKRHPQNVMAAASLAEQLRLQAMNEVSDGDKSKVENDFSNAIEQAKNALKLDPTNASAERTWANTLVVRGDDQGALIHFENAIKADQNNSQLQGEYGSALVVLGRFKDAIPHLDLALHSDLGPGTSVIHRMLGRAYFGIEDFERAVNEEQFALELNQNDTLALETLAEAQARTGRLKEAIDTYAHLSMADPSQLQRPALCVAIAKIREQQGDFDSAVQYIGLAQQIAPKDDDIKKLYSDYVAKAKWAATTRPTTREIIGPMAPATQQAR